MENDSIDHKGIAIFLAERWDVLDKSERIHIIERDPSMRHPRWQSLKDRWASHSSKEMSSVERDATLELLNY